MVNTNKINYEMSDAAVLDQIGNVIKHLRVQQGITQAKLAEIAGLNRYTVGQIEKGDSISLSSLIQMLRALQAFYLLGEFSVTEEISPLEYAKLKKNNKQRVRMKGNMDKPTEDLGW